MVAFIIVTGSGVAAIVAGIKKLRDPGREAVQRGTLIWLCLGMGALVFSGVVIFLYGR